MLVEVLSVVTPVFLIAAVGYVWVRREQPFDNDTISALVMYVGSPCLIYASLISNAPELAVLAQVAGAALLVLISCTLTGALILKILKWPIPAFLPAIAQPNGGNMGLPVAMLAFGETGLALGMAYFFVLSVSQYTMGLTISSGQFQFRYLVRQPVIWAVLLVLGVLTYDIEMPRWFDATASILGGLTIPAMLLMLGTSLARLNITDMGQTLTVALLRLTLGLVFGLAAIALFELEGAIAGVVLLQSTMPAAVFNFVFAQRYNREPDKVAAVILQSTLMSVLTLPLVVAWAMTF